MWPLEKTFEPQIFSKRPNNQRNREIGRTIFNHICNRLAQFRSVRSSTTYVASKPCRGSASRTSLLEVARNITLPEKIKRLHLISLTRSVQFARNQQQTCRRQLATICIKGDDRYMISPMTHDEITGKLIH